MVDEVLDGDGHASEGADLVAGRYCLVDAAGGLQRTLIVD